MLLVQDMTNRISSNRAYAQCYPTGANNLGTGDSQPADCTALTSVKRDNCEWSALLKGAAELSSTGGTPVGAMVGAVGCVTLRSGTNPPAYEVAVAWQGLNQFQTPANTCGQNNFGSEGFRRVLTNVVTVPNLTSGAVTLASCP